MLTAPEDHQGKVSWTTEKSFPADSYPDPFEDLQSTTPESRPISSHIGNIRFGGWLYLLHLFRVRVVCHSGSAISRKTLLVHLPIYTETPDC